MLDEDRGAAGPGERAHGRLLGACASRSGSRRRWSRRSGKGTRSRRDRPAPCACTADGRVPGALRRVDALATLRSERGERGDARAARGPRLGHPCPLAGALSSSSGKPRRRLPTRGNARFWLRPRASRSSARPRCRRRRRSRTRASEPTRSSGSEALPSTPTSRRRDRRPASAGSSSPTGPGRSADRAARGAGQPLRARRCGGGVRAPGSGPLSVVDPARSTTSYASSPRPSGRISRRARGSWISSASTPRRPRETLGREPRRSGGAGLRGRAASGPGVTDGSADRRASGSYARRAGGQARRSSPCHRLRGRRGASGA